MAKRTNRMDFYSPRPEKKMTKHRTCGGTGFRKSYTHVWNGGCFRCDGTGFVQTRASANRIAEWQAIQDAALTIPMADVKPGMAIEGHDLAIVRVVRQRSRRLDGKVSESISPRTFIVFEDGTSIRSNPNRDYLAHGNEVRLNPEGNVPGLFALKEDE